jgi:hypothetical protein
MNNYDLNDYSEAFHADVATNAHALDMLREHAFVENISDILIDFGEIANCEPCHYQARGMKIDAYEFDDDFANLTILVSHWLDENNPSQARVTNSIINQVLKRSRVFFEAALTGKLNDRIEVSNSAHDLAMLIHECRKSLLSVKFILITDGITDQRQAETDIHEGIEIRSVVWDISRAYNFEKTGEREQIAIDFKANYGGAIPCIERPSLGEQYTTYLAFVPGAVLADLYRDWKIRLLERNVRVFLSHRPKVNQGIRDTIRNEPDMFCAYNNGITVQAQAVTLTQLPDRTMGIAQVSDFQIVNGGQTTASLYHTREKFKADLDDIVVQMKLIVINDELKPPDLPENQRLSDVLVPKIGRYSNTQNRIQMADLLANDPPHPELFTLSMNTAAPDPTGGSVQTYWYYEKSRGSYEETRRLDAKTPAQRKKFDLKYPRKQRFDKSKFGKAWNSYRKRPHTVCLGAMKNFAQFNAWLQEQQHEEWQAFFRKTVALIILWNGAERVVRRQKFGGYRHAIVTYSLAWLHHLTGLRIDLDRIWSLQNLDEPILEAIENLSAIVNEHIRATELNVTEWCKKEDCWKLLLEKKAPYIPDLSAAFVTGKGSQIYDLSSKSETDNISFCTEKGAEAWKALSKWLKERGFMQGKQRSQCYNMGRTLKNSKVPSAVLSAACRNIWENAVDGYGWDAEVSN